MVLPDRFELPTSALQVRRTTNCAKGACELWGHIKQCRNQSGEECECLPRYSCFHSHRALTPVPHTAEHSMPMRVSAGYVYPASGREGSPNRFILKGTLGTQTAG